MDWILIGIALAIGFYLAPVIIGLVILVFAWLMVVLIETYEWITSTCNGVWSWLTSWSK